MELAHIAGIFVGQVFTAGAIYGAIRADIRNVVARTESNEKAIAREGARIDQLLMHERG